MALKDIVSEESKAFGERFIKNIKSGNLKRRTLPNSAEDFDEEEVLKRCKKYIESDDFKKTVENVYKD